MSSYRIHSAAPGPARKTACRLLAILVFLFTSSPGQAAVALYQAIVPLHGATEADRNAAFGDALKVAAVRATGRREAAVAPRIVKAAEDPSRFVQQYSTTSDRQLKVGFDGRAMEQLLEQSGLPLWPSERPTTTIYVFGTAAGAAGAPNRSDRGALESGAQLRGVPIAWSPEVIDAATARARAASQSATEAMLVGVANGAGFDWTFGHAGQVARTQGSPGDGIDLAADALAARYATAATRGTSVVAVRIGNVRDVRAYAGLTKYLQELSLVRSLTADEFAGDTVSVRVGLRGDLELLRRIVALDADKRLHAAGTATATQSVTLAGPLPDFVWQP